MRSGRRYTSQRMTTDLAIHLLIANASQREEIARLTAWVHDLQRGMYINCVYCGHRYGPDDAVPATMADVLKAHVERCPKHPMSALRRQVAHLEVIERAAQAVIYASDQCRGHRDCGHSMEPWQALRAATLTGV